MTTPFQLIGGHPALDLVNTLDNRFDPARIIDLLQSYHDVLRFLQQGQWLTTRQKALLEDRAEPKGATRVLTRVRELRETLAVLCYEGISGDRARDALKRLGLWAIKADSHRELTFARGKVAMPLASWTWKPAERRELTLPFWMLAVLVGDLVTSDAWRRVRHCRNDACRWVFLDASKNHSRSWCDMAVCGNRAKARRFQLRRGV